LSATLSTGMTGIYLHVLGMAVFSKRTTIGFSLWIKLHALIRLGVSLPS
jgi:hypothetical protein